MSEKFNPSEESIRRSDRLGQVSEELVYNEPTDEQNIAMAKQMLANIEKYNLDIDATELRHSVTKAEAELDKKSE